MGKKSKKHRGEIITSRRALDKLQRQMHVFYLLLILLGGVIVLTMGAALSFPYDLGNPSPGGFAAWFLLILAYLPLTAVGAVNWLFGIEAAWLVHHEVVVLAVCDLALLVAVWGAVRFFLARRFGVEFVRIVSQFLVIVLAWGVLQLALFGITLLWNHGGMRGSVHRHLELRQGQNAATAELPEKIRK